MMIVGVIVLFLSMLMTGRPEMNKEIEAVIQQKPQRGREKTFGLTRCSIDV